MSTSANSSTLNSKITEALEIIWIAKAIERVGDHATNIAEDVVFIVNGIDIRHTSAQQADEA